MRHQCADVTSADRLPVYSHKHFYTTGIQAVLLEWLRPVLWELCKNYASQLIIRSQCRITALKGYS